MAGNLAIVISARDQASAVLANVGKSADSAIATIGRASALALAGLSTAAIGVGASAVKMAGDFETTLSGIKAVSGASAAQMQQVSRLALQLGKDTAFSAKEAAAGIEELIKGGVAISDVMGGAAKSMLDLAAAGGVNLPEAAEIASNALAMFNLKGENMAHVADLIAGAANASSLSVSDFKFSMAASGAIAAATGQKFDDLAQAIAVMGQAGIKGSDAGTSLKTFLMRLQPTTDAATEAMERLGIVTAGGANAFVNANGSFKSMAEIAGVLQKATGHLTEAQRLQALETMFGSDAIRAAAIFAKQGTAGFNEMAAAMGKVTAASVGAERLNNLNGSIEQLKGSLETAAIVLGSAFLPGVRKVVDGLTVLVNNSMPVLERYGPVVAQSMEKAAQAITRAAGDAEKAIQRVLPVVTQGLDMVSRFWAKNGEDIVAVAVGTWVTVYRTVSGGLAAIQDIVRTAADMVSRFWAKNGEDIVGFIRRAWSEATAIVAAAAARIAQAIDTIREVANQLRTDTEGTLRAWANTVTGWITPVLTRIPEQLREIADRITTWARDDALPAIRGQVAAWGAAFLDWTRPVASEASGRLSAIHTQITRFIEDTQTAILAKLDLWMSAFTDWVRPMLPRLADELAGLTKAILSWMLESRLSFVERLGTWVGAFLGWVLPMIPDLLRSLGSFAAQMLDWIIQKVPEVAKRIDTWKDACIKWADEVIGPLLIELESVLTDLVTWIEDNAPRLIDTFLGEWLPAALNWVVQLADDVIPKLLTVLTGILTWVVDHAPELTEKFLGEWLPAAIGWVAKAAIDIIPKLAGLLVTIGEWIITTGIPKMAELFVKMGAALVNGIIKGAGNLANQLGAFIQAEIRKLLTGGGGSVSAQSSGGMAAIGGAGGGGVASPLPGVPPVALIGGTPAGVIAVPVPGIGGGRSQPVNVVVNVSGSVTAERDLARTIRDELIRLGRANVTTGIA